MMREILARWGIPDVIVCDDWRLKELQDALTLSTSRTPQAL